MPDLRREDYGGRRMLRMELPGNRKRGKPKKEALYAMR